MALTKLTTDLIDSTIVTSINGSTGAVTLETGTDWQATPKTADFTAVAGEGYFVNTTSAAITVTLPSSPSAGDEVSIVDYAGTADTNNIIITSSDNINGASDDTTIEYERGGVSIVYVDATQGWIAYNAVNETDNALSPPTVTVDYLVVAGGGGGSYSDAGGGGAGGLRTSYTNTSSLNGHTETALTLTSATNYTVTVGGGGGGATATSPTNATNGSNSIFSTITSIGGGYGGDRAAENSANAAQTGGCGGGGASVSNTNNLGAAAVTSPVTQGYAGGNGVDLGAYQAGGGGGTNGVGVSASGQGGPGLEVNIIGTTGNYYGGGGGGGSDSGSTSNGGVGGGGNGGRIGVNATSGSSNTGGGGGGGGGGTSVGAAGGSGVVIIRYPNTHTVTIGAGLTSSTATDGSDKITTFTAGTGTISFS